MAQRVWPGEQLNNIRTQLIFVCFVFVAFAVMPAWSVLYIYPR